jgi:L-cysteine desulfidase
MHPFTGLIKNDMRESLGVTEPGAIALAVSRARSLCSGDITAITVEINSGIFKNAFTCGIPGTEETGNVFAAALGAVAGDWTRGLASLEGIGGRDITAARELVAHGRVKVILHEISSALYIKAAVRTSSDLAEVTILGAHDHIARIALNGKILEEDQTTRTLQGETAPADITQFTLKDFWTYAEEVLCQEIAFIQRAYDLQLKLMEEGAGSRRTKICKTLIAGNGGALLSKDELKSAHAMTAAAIEARVSGLSRPAMSITGSGNHGIICTLPLYAASRVQDIPWERLLRATALSYLVTMYIKEFSGKLSAFCGCAIAAGTGVSVAWLFLKGGSLRQAERVIANMASSLTGVICTGGNPACVLKTVLALDIGYKSIQLALDDVSIDEKHGICGKTAEETMRYMGRIASPGMIQTEKEIVDIFRDKSATL